MSYSKKTILLIIIATVIRCIAAGSVELGNDEVYYRIFASHLQWNYFDHPPMVAWLIRFSTVNLFFDSELFIRLGAILSAAAATWLLFLTGKKLGTAQTGFYAAAIYTATIYGSIVAGTFILPDSPQMVCWTAGLYLLCDVTDSKNIRNSKRRKILLFGIVAGLGMLCKIHTSFLWLGFLLYIILYNRRWLFEPVIYFSGIITLLFFYPVIKWNIDNDFITFLYHGSRVNISRGGFDLTNFLSFAFGQVFYCNPLIFVYMIIALMAAFKNQLPIYVFQKRLLILSSLPLIFLAAGISLFKNVLPHWPGPAYSGLILLTACYFSKRKKKNGLPVKRILPVPVIIANALLILIMSGAVLSINFIPGTLGKKDDRQRGDGDFTLDMYGWKQMAKTFRQIVTDDQRRGIMKPEAVIISNKWFPAAHIDFYLAMPLKKDLLAIGEISEIHQYAWLNKERKKLMPGDDAYCIVPSNDYFDAGRYFAVYFSSTGLSQTIEQKRNGVICRQFYVWQLKNYKGN